MGELWIHHERDGVTAAAAGGQAWFLIGQHIQLLKYR